MAGTTHAALGQSESQRFFATYAEKEEKKMTHSKQTTQYPQAPEILDNSYLLIEAVIDAVATSP